MCLEHDCIAECDLKKEIYFWKKTTIFSSFLLILMYILHHTKQPQPFLNKSNKKMLAHHAVGIADDYLIHHSLLTHVSRNTGFFVPMSFRTTQIHVRTTSYTCSYHINYIRNSTDLEYLIEILHVQHGFHVTSYSGRNDLLPC